MPSHHHLGNTLTGCNLVFRIREVDKDHGNLSSVIRINGSWRIEHAYSLLQCEAAPRTHLGLKSSGKFDGEPCGHKCSLQRANNNWCLKICMQVHAGRKVCLVHWERLVSRADNTHFHCVGVLHFCQFLRSKIRMIKR